MEKVEPELNCSERCGMECRTGFLHLNQAEIGDTNLSHQPFFPQLAQGSQGVGNRRLLVAEMHLHQIQLFNTKSGQAFEDIASHGRRSRISENGARTAVRT